MGKKKQNAPNETIYQLKITLWGIRPPIWRRLEVKDCTLERLHEIIQVAMGWESYHLWSFQIGGREFGPSEMGDDPFGDLEMEDSSTVMLSRIIAQGHKKFVYLYDFGDGWEHQIQVEKTLPPQPKVKSPRCIKGKRACPPEDCGGPWGYQSFLETISNPDHDEHEEMLEWVGGEFDSEEFDLETVNAELSQLD